MIFYLEAGYFDNEEDEASKGLLLHDAKGGAHDSEAFGRTRVDR